MMRIFLTLEILTIDSALVSRGHLIEGIIQLVTRYLGRVMLANRPGQYVFVLQNG